LNSSPKKPSLTGPDTSPSTSSPSVSLPPANLLSYAALLEAIVESSDDAIISKTLDGIIMSWNPAAARLFGYTYNEIVGSSILRLIPPTLHSEEPIIISRLIAGERIEHFETVRVKKNGEHVDVSLTISPIKDASGKVIGASKILRDISDRKRLQLSLLQAEKLAATGRMAASIAHEINNPLEGLLNLIYLARNCADDPVQVRNYLETAEGELVRVSHIARQTLGYYRENVSPILVSLARIVHDVMRIYRTRLEANGIAIHTPIEELPWLEIKRGEITQVLSNLVANSLYAMPSGGELIIVIRRTVYRGTPHALIEVRDTGCGIPPQHLTSVFEPFFTTRSTIGTGIGLWVARQFVEGHGGSIELASSTDTITHGTTISVYLPMQPPEVAST
jgi:PAS domain S-box-containing protein